MKNINMKVKYLEYLKRVQALAKTGIIYAESPYDKDRYQEINKMTIQVLAEIGNTKVEKIENLFMDDMTYPTPKVDIRSVVFKDEKILMVQEETDSKWTIPGGWAEVGYTPAETAEKEAYEESGLLVKAKKILAVLDKQNHSHPPSKYYIYKIFILCEKIGGDLKSGYETKDARFFGCNELPEPSLPRITLDQINMLFDFQKEPDRPVVFD